MSAHGSLPGSSGLRGRVKEVYDAALVRPMLRGAALLFAQTAHEARLYERFGGLREAIVQLPLPLPPLDGGDTPAPGSFRQSIGVSPETPLLLFLGRVNRLKGLDVLIESVEPLLASGTVLAVVGRDDAGDGNDIVYGGRGRDRVRGGLGQDVIRGGANADRLAGGDGQDAIYGGRGPDTLYGGAAADAIWGGAGRDVVYGGPGNDVIRVGGDKTADAVHCGRGWDVVYLGRFDIADASCERKIRNLEP